MGIYYVVGQQEGPGCHQQVQELRWTMHAPELGTLVAQPQFTTQAVHIHTYF